MADDVFCKIIGKEIDADIVAEGDEWVAFKDIHPQAPVHILVVPKKHIESLESSSKDDIELLGRLLAAVKTVAGKLGLAENGYRVIINQGGHGGQAVKHLHLHILGGRSLGAKIIA